MADASGRRKWACACAGMRHAQSPHVRSIVLNERAKRSGPFPHSIALTLEEHAPHGRHPEGALVVVGLEDDTAEVYDTTGGELDDGVACDVRELAREVVDDGLCDVRRPGCPALLRLPTTWCAGCKRGCGTPRGYSFE